MATYLGGISLRSTLRNVTVNGTIYTALSGPDTMTAGVYDSATNTIQGASVNGSGDGSGNFTATVLAPATAGDYYVRWNMTLGGAVGALEIPFTVKAHE